MRTREGLSSDARQILEQRAKALAQPLDEERAGAAGATRDLLTFSCAGSTYAVAVTEAVAVVPLTGLTKVPGAPFAVQGVVNHRGRIVAAVDIGRMVAGAERGISDGDLGVVIATGDAVLAVVTETVPEIVSVEEDELVAAERSGAPQDGIVRSLTAGMTAVLDVEALVRDPRIAIQDEIE